MTGGRRPGRVQRIAYDATPLNATRPDVDARIGWLLAMTRLHHREPTFRSGHTFLEALADAGCVASRSLLSRWESGEVPITYEAMTAWEKALGLEPGRLSSLTGYMRSAIPGVKARVVRPQLDPTSREYAERLDELLELAENGKALPRDWQDIGWHLTAAPVVHLRPATWESLAHQMVHQLPRAVKVPYRQYSTAAMNLASVYRAQDFLVGAIADYLAAPGVQVLLNPIGLLDRLPTRPAARLVLELIESPPTASAKPAAVWVAAQKVAEGQFTEEERTRLDMLVLAEWRANPDRAGEELAELIAILPPGLRATLTEAASRAGKPELGYVVTHAEQMSPAKAQRLAGKVAEAARKRVPQEPVYAEDRMLPRLVREALLHRDSERRHLAALLISASPFADTVTDELLTLLGDDCPPWLRARLATTVRYLSSEVHRMRMLTLMNDPDEHVAVPLLQGLGHMGYTSFADLALRSTLQPEWSLRERAKMYALGMTGSPGLGVLAESAQAPEWQRDAARWWRQVGPAIRNQTAP